MWAVLCLLALSCCATKDRVDLPRLGELKAELRACSDEVKSVDIYHFSTAPFLSIDIDGRGLGREDAFALVGIVREMAVEEDFQRDYYDLMGEDGWERTISGQYYPDDIEVRITVDGGMYEFSSQLFADGTPATGGKGQVYDGYATWHGSFSQDGRTAGYFSNEDIFGG